MFEIVDCEAEMDVLQIDYKIDYFWADEETALNIISKLVCTQHIVHICVPSMWHSTSASICTNFKPVFLGNHINIISPLKQRQELPAIVVQGMDEDHTRRTIH